MIKEESEIGKGYRLDNLVNNLNKGMDITVTLMTKNNIDYYSINILEPNAAKRKGKRYIYNVNVSTVTKKQEDKILYSLIKILRP